MGTVVVGVNDVEGLKVKAFIILVLDLVPSVGINTFVGGTKLESTTKTLWALSASHKPLGILAFLLLFSNIGPNDADANTFLILASSLEYIMVLSNEILI